MTWAMSSGVRSNITKIAMAGVLIAIPTAVVSVPAYAAPGFGGTPNTPAVLRRRRQRIHLPMHHSRLRHRRLVSTTTQMTQMTGGHMLAPAVSLSCQREAAETAIFLAEVAGAGRKNTERSPTLTMSPQRKCCAAAASTSPKR